MFKVVETIERGEKHYCVVPNSWEKNCLLFWPRHLKDGELKKLTKDISATPGENWATMTCVVKASADSLSEGKQLESLYSKFTDTESEERFKKQRSMAPKKRMKKAKKKESEEEEDFNRAMENMQYNNTMEYSQLNLNSTFLSNPTQLNDSYQVNDMYELMPAAENIQVNIENDNVLPLEAINVNSETESSFVVLPAKETIEEIKTESSFVVLPAKETLIEEIKTSIKNIEKNMKEQINGIHIKLDRILKHIGESPCDRNSGVEILLTKNIVFPLKTLQEFFELNSLLLTKEFRSEMVNRLSAIGGREKVADGSKIMYRLVDYMFAPEVLNKFSWTGSSKTPEKKECFQKLINIVDLLYDVVYMADCRHSHQRNEDFLKNKILKHSKQRLDRKRKLQNGSNSDLLLTMELLEEEYVDTE